MNFNAIIEHLPEDFKRFMKDYREVSGVVGHQVLDYTGISGRMRVPFKSVLQPMKPENMKKDILDFPFSH